MSRYVIFLEANHLRMNIGKPFHWLQMSIMRDQTCKINLEFLKTKKSVFLKINFQRM